MLAGRANCRMYVYVCVFCMENIGKTMCSKLLTVILFEGQDKGRLTFSVRHTFV